MTVVPFVKASACGNDFLSIDGQHAPADLAGFTRSICDRHNGVGADGVDCISPAADADIQARLFNADGSEAEISGNGTRCVAAYLFADSLRERVTVRTGAGIKTCALISHDGMLFEFETAMGKPQVSEEFSIKTAFGEVRGTPVSMGNPHFSVFVNGFPTEWQSQGAAIGMYRDFQHGMNVELVKVLDSANIEVRFYERGVGETQSSGTGSCAAAVASIFSQRANSPLPVHATGGTQTVRWDEEVFLRGPVQIVFRGEYTL